MIKNDYVVRAQKFVRSFAPYIDKNQVTIRSMISAVGAFNKDYNRKVILDHGVSRIVLLTSDYCIKIDRTDSRSDLWGNCEKEYKAYMRMKRLKCREVFCPVEKYTYNNVNYYIMPMCSKTDEYDVELCDVTDGLTARQTRFIEKHFRDLHSGNIGVLHGKPIIIDYACNNF